MRLGINATILNDKPTGFGIYIEHTIREVCKTNRRTIIFSSIEPNGICEYGFVKTHPKIKGGYSLFNNILRFIYINSILRYKIKKAEIDLLFCPSIEYPFTTRFPIVVGIVDLHPLYFPDQFGLSAIHFRFSLNFLHLYATRVIVISNFVRDELLRYSKVKRDMVDVVYLSYDDSLFKSANINNAVLPKSGIKEPYILFVGNLFPYKNVHSLIKTFLRIKSHITHSLVIVGNTKHCKEPLPKDERIFYLDYVQRSDLPSLYGHADVLIHPSLSEGFGFSPLDAMACGTPVIASNRASIPEIVGDAAVLIDPLNVDEMVQTTLDVLRNKSLQNELIEKGLRRIKLFSWQKTAEKILSSCEKAFRSWKK